MLKSTIKSILFWACLLFLFQPLSASIDQNAEPPKETMKRLAHLAYEHLTQDPDLVLDYCNNLEKLASQEQDTSYLVYALNLKGVIYRHRLNYPAALRTLMKAYKLDEKNPSVVLNLANTHRLAKNYKDALYFYEVLNSISPTRQRSQAIGQLGLLYFEKGEINKAFEYTNELIELALNSTDSLMAYLDLSYYYVETEELEQARESLEKAQQMLEEKDTYEDNYFNANFSYTYGLYHLQKKNIAEAEKHLLRVIELGEKQHLNHLMQQAYQVMQKIAFHKQDEKMLERYQQKEMEVSERIFNYQTDYYELLVQLKDEQQQELLDEKQQKAWLNYFFAAFAVCSLLLALLFVFQSRRKQKNLKRELQESKLTIDTLKRKSIKQEAQLMALQEAKDEKMMSN
jgi:tetratricopeptide (TPR) repeat protein